MRTRHLVATAAALCIVVAACDVRVPDTTTPPGTPGASPIVTMPATPRPTPTPRAATTPTPSTTPQPSPTATVPPLGPTASDSPGPSSADRRPPLPLVNADAAVTGVQLAPSSGGRLFVAVWSVKGTVVALLGAQGNIRPGWPALLKGASRCRLDVDATDDSVRAVCMVGRRVRAYALDTAGRPMSGWPVDLPSGYLPTDNPSRVVNGSLHVVLMGRDPASARLVRVTRDGSLRTGVRMVQPDDYAFSGASVGPDGVAYVVDVVDGSAVWAFDLDGFRPGFPVKVDAWASAPAFGPDGRMYLAVDRPDEADGTPSSQVVGVTREGRPAPGWPISLPVDAWTAFGDPTAPPFPPVVAADGTVYVTGWTGWMEHTIAYALDPSGARRPGWPYRADEPIRWGGSSAWACACEPCVDPRPAWETPPTGGPDGSLLLVLGPPGSDPNRLVVVRRDGTVKPGWPVTLTESGSAFASVRTGPGGVVYAYAIEPAGSRRDRCGERHPVYSGTVVALDRRGDPVYATTIVAP